MAGMKVSLPGVLIRAADRLEKTRDAKDLGFMLKELYRHLTELRNNKELIEEFFDLWVE